MKLLLAAVACLHLAFAGAVFSQELGVEIVGRPATTGVVTADDLAKLPSVEQDVRYQTSKGEEQGRYKGPLLWSILEARGIGELPGHNAQLQHSFVVEGRDGYKIVFSVGEIDPDFGNAPIQLATEKDGKPLGAEGYRLVVPGDKRGARYVKDVVRIELK